MDSAKADPLLKALLASHNLTPEKIEAVRTAFAQSGASPAHLADQLDSLGMLSRYQFKKIQTGRAHELFFGDYFIFGKVGEGGMGKVYQAYCQRLQSAVALKVVRTQLLSNKTVMMRYEREARAAQQLDHPNIVKLLHAGDVHGKYYLAMEFVDGSDLSRMVKEFGPLPYPEACEYIRQSALGLQHAHDLRFVHRDIKPSNLLVFGTRPVLGAEWNATVKILDMGLVRSLEEDLSEAGDELTRDGTVVGTPDYMSPEQGKNSSTVDSRADLYSLGCTLYYLLRGHVPFQKGTPIDKLIAHQIDPVPDVRVGRPELPPMLGDVVARLMRKKPNERYQTAGEVAEALLPFTPQALTLELNRSGQTLKKGMSAPSQIYLAVDLAPPSLTPSDATLRPHSATIPVAEAMPVATPATPTPQPPPAPTTKKNPLTSKTKTIPKPVEYPASSGSMKAPAKGLHGSGKRKKSQKKAKPFPVVPVAVAVGVLAVFAIITLIVLNRVSQSNNEKPNPNLNLNPQPVQQAASLRPIIEFLPDDATAILIYRGKPYFHQLNLADVKANVAHQSIAQRLATQYKFDVRMFDRGVVAFSKNPLEAVAAGEGAFLTPSWKQSLNAEADPDGTLRTTPEPGVNAIVLPQPNAYVLGVDSPALQSVVARAKADRRAPVGISPLMNEAVALAESDPTPPLAVFIATGDFVFPNRPGAPRDTLAKHGVELLVITIRFDDRFRLEMTLTGKKKEPLADFLNIDLPGRFDKWHPELQPLARAFLASPPRMDLHDVGFRLSTTATWEWEPFLKAMEPFWQQTLPTAKSK